jgi:hypothetical protein
MRPSMWSCERDKVAPGPFGSPFPFRFLDPPTIDATASNPRPTPNIARGRQVSRQDPAHHVSLPAPSSCNRNIFVTGESRPHLRSSFWFAELTADHIAWEPPSWALSSWAWLQIYISEALLGIEGFEGCLVKERRGTSLDTIPNRHGVEFGFGCRRDRRFDGELRTRLIPRLLLSNSVLDGFGEQLADLLAI